MREAKTDQPLCTRHNGRRLLVQAPRTMDLVAYYRVSTDRQGRSGLGLEAQQERVTQLAAERGAHVLAEFVEVESGRKTDRPQLAAALKQARKLEAAIAVAKLDRLARDAELILRLSREAQTNGIGGFLFCDLPDIDATTAAGRLILGVMGSVAEFESRRISERTKEALLAAKARGVKLGGLRPNTAMKNAEAKAKAQTEAEKLRGVMESMVCAGMTLRAMGEALAGAGKTTKNGQTLSPTQVKRLVERLGLLLSPA